jgi:hypothetical protein
MADSVLCSTCHTDCTNHHWLCDMQDGAWCGTCFSRKPCGIGKHGEGCPTQVFDDASAQTVPTEQSK